MFEHAKNKHFQLPADKHLKSTLTIFNNFEPVSFIVVQIHIFDTVQTESTCFFSARNQCASFSEMFIVDILE